MYSITQSTSRRDGEPSVLIIADDLTGAADSAVACAERGLETVVALGETSDLSAADAIAFDANTRCLTRDAAAAETARLVRTHAKTREGILFKKIDSTLRGHIGSEIAALLDARRHMARSAAAQRTIGVLAPAFPALGRTTVKGRQCLGGVPLDDTELWRREGMTGSASLLDMMSLAGLASNLVPIEAIRGRDSGIGAMRNVIDRVDVLVCDAETNEDLAAVARASLATGCDLVWAGSAGLVGHLVDATDLTRPRAASPRGAPAAGPLLFVVGTLSPVSRCQAALLATEDIVALTIEGAILDDVCLADFADRLAAAFAAGEDILILLSTSKGAPSRPEAAALLATLSELIAPYAASVGGLFATGGETARAILTGMGVTTLRLVSEIENGVPLSVAAAPRPFPVITKAGGFGDVTTMLNCRRALRELVSGGFGSALTRMAQQ